MAYAVFGDIESEFRDIDFSTGAVSETEVTEFISQEEAIINATVSNRYTVPATGTEAVKVLKKISIAFVAYRVAAILNLKKDLPIPDNRVVQDLSEGASYRMAVKLLNAIGAGDIPLDDATERSSNQGIKSYNATKNILPLWKRDTKQW